MFRNVLLLPLLVGILTGSSSAPTPTDAKPVRRAVVIGINRYQSRAMPPGAIPQSNRMIPKGKPPERTWTDLDGAVNDAETIKVLLTGRLGFQSADILTLEDRQATAAAILGAIQKHLIDDAQPGDISLLFYAGHGSLIRNLATPERSGFDETLVPVDAPLGVPDIRDKELARILRAGVLKGVLLTAIFDSCHSGSIARGKWNASAKTRQLSPDSRYVEDPPDRDANGKPLPDAESGGMLVLSASQDFEPAIEIDTGAGPHGLLTWALSRVLQTAPPNERVDRLFQRVRAVMQSEGSLQEPVLAGAGRGERSLLGLPANDTNQVTVAAERVWDNRVRLGGGFGIGLNKGCELRRISSSKQGAGARLRVDKVLGLASSEAAIVNAASSIQPGDIFELTRWAASEASALKVYIPGAPLSMDRLASLGATLSSLRARFHWIDDSSQESPTHVMSWSGKSWILERNPASGLPVDLGLHPTAESVAGHLPPNAAFLLLLPAPTAFVAEIQVGPGTMNDAIALEKSPAQAHYVLSGRYRDGAVSYAWLLPRVTEPELGRRYEDARLKGMPPPAMAMPLRSDWTSDGAGLADALQKLARIYGWLQLDAPADPLRFPYRLALRDLDSAKLMTGGTVRKGQGFKVVIASDPDRLREAVAADALSPRWIYVFCIDQHGKSQLLFPPHGQGNSDNLFPLPAAKMNPPASYEPDLRSELTIGPPFGIDTYYLLASEEPLPWPEALEFEGVLHDSRGASNALGLLIDRVGRANRGPAPTVPLNWSVARLLLRSIDDGGGDVPPKL
jgi:hypothetical protein